MKLKFSSMLAVGLLSYALGSSPAFALTTDFVTFDPGTTQADGTSFAQGPSIYVAVPHEQIIDTTPAIFSGGVILGLATFFPAIQFASSPNVYGTADFGNGLSNTLSITVNNPLQNITNEISFALFNGETFAQTYTVTTNFTDGSSSNTILGNIAPNWQSGYALVDLLFPALNISSVTINATNNGIPVTNTAWDFLIDDVAFNQKVTDALPNYVPSPVPPSVDPVVTQLPEPIQLPEPVQTVEVQSPEIELVENELTNSELLSNFKATHAECGLLNGNAKSKCYKEAFALDYPGKTMPEDNANKVDIVDNTQVNVFVDPCRQGVCSNKGVIDGQLVQAVPEPESYAMMLAGFGVMGFVARRRRVVS